MTPTSADLMSRLGEGGDMFLDLTLKRAGKVKGESSSPGHVGDITVLGLGWGVSAPRDAVAGQASGRRSYRNLVVEKTLDTASTALMTAVAMNDEVRKARLCLRKADGEQVDYCTITLERSRVAAYDLDVDPGGRPVEKVSFSFADIEVGYVPGRSPVGGEVRTWAGRYKFAIEQYKKNNPIEVSLFADMLEAIPSYVIGNESTWASVIVGFDTYARRNAIPYTGGAVADFESSVFGLRGFDPKSWFDRITTGTDVHDAVKLPNVFKEAVVLVRSGPQVFNRAWYEGAWGRPPLPWSAYYPGWMTPKGTNR